VVVPASTLEEKLSELRHIGRVHLEVAPAMIVTPRINGPRHVANAERLEKLGDTERAEQLRRLAASA
jgi:hypothetical protein